MTRLNGVGAAFCGGGFRSFAEVAILEDMERNGVSVAASAGTSMGSLVATLVAAGLPASKVADLLLEMDQRVVDAGILKKARLHVLNMVSDLGLIPSATIEEQVRIILDEVGVRTFDDLAMPLAMPSVDVLTGELVVFTGTPGLFEDAGGGWTCLVDKDQDLAKTITASASYPLAIAPTTYAGHTLMDGGSRMNLPTPLFDRSSVDAVVGVGMIRHYKPLENPGPLEVWNRTVSYGATQLDRLYAQAADIYVNLPVSGEDAFQAGSGAQVIAEARQMVTTQPIDWSLARPGLMTAVARGLVDAVARATRANGQY
jgi:predicted acylesterase/phospholipase RssA